MRPELSTPLTSRAYRIASRSSCGRAWSDSPPKIIRSTDLPNDPCRGQSADYETKTLPRETEAGDAETRHQFGQNRKNRGVQMYVQVTIDMRRYDSGLSYPDDLGLDFAFQLAAAAPCRNSSACRLPPGYRLKLPEVSTRPGISSGGSTPLPCTSVRCSPT